jgi:hypothetical protein
MKDLIRFLRMLCEFAVGTHEFLTDAYGAIDQQQVADALVLRQTCKQIIVTAALVFALGIIVVPGAAPWFGVWKCGILPADAPYRMLMGLIFAIIAFPAHLYAGVALGCLRVPRAFFFGGPRRAPLAQAHRRDQPREGAHHLLSCRHRGSLPVDRHRYVPNHHGAVRPLGKVVIRRLSFRLSNIAQFGQFDCSSSHNEPARRRHRLQMEDTTTERRANVPAVVVGVFAVITALLGLLYNATTAATAWRGAFDSMLKQDEYPYFYQAFFIMSGVCVFCFIVLLVCGVDLVRSRLRWARLLSLVLLFEVGYFFAAGSLWREPTIGLSVAAATGVANGGLMAQFIILLPFWAPLLLWWARSRHQYVPA